MRAAQFEEAAVGEENMFVRDPQSTCGAAPRNARPEARARARSLRWRALALAAPGVALILVTCTPNAHVTIERPQFQAVRVIGVRARGPCGSGGLGTLGTRGEGDPLDGGADADPGDDGGDDAGAGGPGDDGGAPGKTPPGTRCDFTLQVQAVLVNDRQQVIRECDRLESPTGESYVVRTGSSPVCAQAPDAGESFRREDVTFNAMLRPTEGGTQQTIMATGASAIRFVPAEGPYAVALIVDNSASAGQLDRASSRVIGISTFARQLLCNQGQGLDTLDPSCLFSSREELSVYTLSSSGGTNEPVPQLGTPEARLASSLDGLLQTLAAQAGGQALVFEAVRNAATALRQRVVREGDEVRLRPVIVIFSAAAPAPTGLDEALAAVQEQGGVERIPVYVVGLEWSEALAELAASSGGTFILARSDVAGSIDLETRAQGVEFALAQRVLPSLLGRWEMDIPVSITRSAAGATFVTDSADLSVRLGGATTPAQGRFITQLTVP